MPVEDIIGVNDKVSALFSWVHLDVDAHTHGRIRERGYTYDNGILF